ncbi:MAG: flagellar hook-basal body complex protein [Planctomycetaceae bacterium]|nr:flagellar hook-basal body complex protein [Planctomycetaceae bacterium]
MANALITGVSGLNSHQKMLEVIGNNLANLNTTAYKSRRILFSDLLYETVRASSDGTPGLLGGTNPAQIGTGSQVSQVDSQFSQGNLSATGAPLDLAIEGDGFFVVNTGSETLYTRAGALQVDEDGVLVDPSTGYRVQRFGSVGESTGTGVGFQVAGDADIRIPFGATIPGQATANVSIAGNLPSDANIPTIEVVESQLGWTAGGGTASAASLLNGLDANTVGYIAGDSILINGTDADGSAISASLSVDGTTTLGDLVAQIDSAFSGASASLDANGRIVLTADDVGEALLSLSLSDDPGNTGGTDFASNSFVVSMDGRDGDVVRGSVEVFDTRGGAHTISLSLQKQMDGSWNLNAGLDPTQGTVVDGLVTGITFNEDGSLASAGGAGTGDSALSFQFTGTSTTQAVNISFGTLGGLDGLTELATDASLGAGQDGLAVGALVSVQVSSDGIVNGIASNGSAVFLAQLAVASFRNPGGLESRGQNYYAVSLSSGNVEIGSGLAGSRGAVRSGQLEQSNVDIAEEFTQLIIAQRGFSANARTITIADEILEELTNLVR